MLCAADTTLYNSIRRSPINDPGEYLSVGSPESDAYRLTGLGRGFIPIFIEFDSLMEGIASRLAL